MKIVGMVPSRLGSKRVKYKGLRLLNGEPLVSYAVSAASKSKLIQQVFVNSDSELICTVGESYGAKPYLRDKALATSKAKSDQFVYDFLKNNKCDVLVLVNPTAPLITPIQIDDGIKQFLREKLDTLHTVVPVQTQAVFKGKPINFDVGKPWVNSQSLDPIYALCFSFMIWRKKSFMKAFEENGHGYFSGKVGFFVLDKFSGVDVDTEEDLFLAEAIMRQKWSKVRYHEVVYSAGLAKK